MRVAPKAGAAMLSLLLAGSGVGAVVGVPGVANAQDAAAMVRSAAASDLVVTDNYPALYGWLANSLGDATTVKIATTCGVSDSGNGTTTIPAQVTQLVGWQAKSWFDEEGEKVRQLGYASSYETLTFASGATTEVRSLTLKLLDDRLVVPAGANVTFKNCTFVNRVKIEKGGKATFENCTFSSGTILNNGQASYTGSTREPTNKGTAESAFQSLGLVAAQSALSDGVHTREYADSTALTLSGTNAGKATLTATVGQKDSGLSAAVENGELKVFGTPTAAGAYTVTVTASAPDEAGSGVQTASATVAVAVRQNYTFSVEGTLDAVRTGQGDYQDSSNHELEVFVTDEAGNKQSFYNFSCTAEGAGYVLKPQVSPDGCGLNATLFNAGGKAAVTLSGTAGTAGTYQVGAVATLGDYTFATNTEELRIYSGAETLASQIAGLATGTGEWDMEPYEIDRSDNAVIPTWLHRIYGSHESGLYGQIGNATDDFASDTITIPAGADVTLENIKVNSSVKIVVEKGAKLTLTDSVAFGPIEVNGGTLTLNRSSATTSTITLNDGSTLADSEVVSHAQFLTDGRKPTPTAPTSVVIVNGNVTFAGESSIKPDQSQVGLEVNGDARVPLGSSLTVAGGNGGTAPGEAASAIKLNGGTISGEGSLTATGGSYELGGSGVPATAVTGEGVLATSNLVLAGGDADTVFGRAIDGADAGVKAVVVTTPAAGRTITGGKGVNGGADGLGEESVTVREATEQPGESPKPGENGGSGSSAGADSSSAAGAKKQTSTSAAAAGKKRTPQTGDATSAVPAAAFTGAVAALAAGVLIRRRD